MSSSTEVTKYDILSTKVPCFPMYVTAYKVDVYDKVVVLGTE